MQHKKGFYEKYIKCPQDFVLALLAFVVLSPILFIIAVLVKFNLGSPVLFKQERPGLNGKIFMLYKFRTMSDSKDESGNLLPDNERLGKFGKILRSTSLDELPSLINVLRLELSLVGPRPLLVQYLSRYNEHQKRRHEVRPGLSGLAQVNGRNTLSWEEKFDLDVEYVDNITFFGDLKIIFLTVWKAFFKRDGISQEGQATMSEFMGSGEEKINV